MANAKTAFKDASRLGLTFNTARGDLNVTQLWTIPLTSNDGFNLNTLANSINKRIKAADEEEINFVDGEDTQNDNIAAAKQIDEIRLEVVKVIIKDLKKEADAEAQAAEDRKNDKIIEDMIAKKQLEKLDENDIESLTSMLSYNKGNKKKKKA